MVYKENLVPVASQEINFPSLGGHPGHGSFLEPNSDWIIASIPPGKDDVNAEDELEENK